MLSPDGIYLVTDRFEFFCIPLGTGVRATKQFSLFRMTPIWQRLAIKCEAFSLMELTGGSEICNLHPEFGPGFLELPVPALASCLKSVLITNGIYLLMEGFELLSMPLFVGVRATKQFPIFCITPN